MTDIDLTEIFSALVSAAKSGSWIYVLAVLLMGATWAFRKYLAERWAFWCSDAGGVVLALTLSVTAAFATAIGAAATTGSGVSLTLAGTLLLGALKASVAAMGGWSGLRKLLLPLARWLLGKLGVKIGAQKIATATAAGHAAVKKAPGKGAAGVAGNPTDIP